MFQWQSIFIITESGLLNDDKLLLAAVTAIPLLWAQEGDIV